MSPQEIRDRKTWKKDNCDYIPLCSNSEELYQKDFWEKSKLSSQSTKQRPERDEIEPIRGEALRLYELMIKFLPPSMPGRAYYSWQEQ